MTGWPSTFTLLKATCSYLLPSAEPREGHVLAHSILRSAPSHTLHQLSHVTMLLLAVLTALENTQNNLHVCYLKTKQTTANTERYICESWGSGHAPGFHFHSLQLSPAAQKGQEPLNSHHLRDVFPFCRSQSCHFLF